MNDASASCNAPAGNRSILKTLCFWIGVFILLLALGLRLAYVFEYTDEIGIDYYTLEQTDNHTFHQWARNIAQGDWACKNQVHPYHQWTQEVAPEDQWLRWYGKKEIYHQAPLYPYLVGVLYALFDDSVLYVRIFQAILGAFTCLLVFLTGRLYFGRNAGTVAGLLVALAGFHFYYDAFVLREGLITFLTIAFVYLASRAFRQRRPAPFVWAGIVLGLGITAKPTAMLLVPPYLIALFIVFKDDARARKWLRACLFLLAVLAPLAPLYLRNAALDCPITKISTRGPTAFINGNLRGQTGTLWSPPAEQTRTILREANYRLGGVINQTLKSYIDSPIDYLGMLWGKTRAFFNSFEIPNNTNYYLIKRLSKTLDLARVSYQALAVLALVGMLLLLPQLGRNWQLYLVTILVSLATIAFFIVARFRQPVVPLFAVFAGCTVVWIFKKIRNQRWTALAPALLAIGLLLAWTTYDKPLYSNAMSAYSGAMKRLIALQNFPEAARFKERLFEENIKKFQSRFLPEHEARLQQINEAFAAFDLGSLHPHDAAERYLYFAQGYCLLLDSTKRKEFDEYAGYTQKAAEKALALDPEIRGAHKILGFCLAEQASRAEDKTIGFELLARAAQHVQLELENNPGDLECIQGLGSLQLAFGNIEAAVRHYKTYLKRSQQWDPEVAYQLVRILIDLPALPERLLSSALKLAEDLYSRDPRDIRLCLLYADALEKAGRHEEAAEMVRKLIDLDPESAAEYGARIDNNPYFKENTGSKSPSNEG